jgi:hypothetical protein
MTRVFSRFGGSTFSDVENFIDDLNIETRLKELEPTASVDIVKKRVPGNDCEVRSKKEIWKSEKM